MRNIVWVILSLVVLARAQSKYNLCVTTDKVTESDCYAVSRQDSEVQCLHVSDSAECAIRLTEGKADFAVFNAEELLLAHKFGPFHSLVPILQLRHKDKQDADFEFQTVAVTHADLSQNIRPGFDHLRNGGLCHPGFGKSQWWNDYILKTFERKVNRPSCQENFTVIENEIRGLKDFFGKACRPGAWAADENVDEQLKKKYPELCALCDDRIACTYYAYNRENHGHLGALDCLINGRGKVAYVALSYVQEYLRNNRSYEFLCPNGKTIPLSGSPCSWLKQPWNVIVARRDIANNLKSKLIDWLSGETYPSESWKRALNKIVKEDHVIFETEKSSIIDYLSTGRETDVTNIAMCDRDIRWCTINDLETEKCKWMSRAAMALGVEPKISCVQTNSTFQCFREISEQRADIIVIDSNYGYLARTIYGLSTVLYTETKNNKNSVIIAVTREPNDNNFPITSFHDLKGKKACFPEYGGIDWLSFIKVARTSGVISSRSCDYPRLTSELLSGACTPGIKDLDHSKHSVPKDISSKLCSACWTRNDTSCSANETNRYYGDKGAMRCLTDKAGEVAFIEVNNINVSDFEEIPYRILCKNGSLAMTIGFDFDELCALSVTIDSEVISRKNNTQVLAMDIVLALLKIEDWLGYNENAWNPIRIYGPFNGTRDLIFKDSTSALVSTSSTTKSVVAYKELFEHIDSCTDGAFTANASFIFVGLVALYHFLSGHVH